MIEMETTKELVQTDVSATIIQLDTLQVFVFFFVSVIVEINGFI